MALIRGSDVIVTTAYLDDFEDGDWIRISSECNDFIFNILRISNYIPFTIKLSSSYMGQTKANESIYQNGTKEACLAYQYILFDIYLGDIQELRVDGSKLVGANPKVKF